MIDVVPFVADLAWRCVRLKVVGEDYRRVARDILVPGIAGCDSAVCSRYSCGQGEKDNYGRKQARSGVSDYYQFQNAMKS